MDKKTFLALKTGDPVLWDGTGGEQPTMTGLVVQSTGYTRAIAWDDGTGCTVRYETGSDLIDRLSTVSYEERLKRIVQNPTG